MSNQSPLRQERTKTQQLRIELISSLTTLDELFEETTRKDDEIIDECVDNLLDVLIHALPERTTMTVIPDIERTYREKYGEIWPYVLAISQVKQLLLKAKGDK